MNIEDLTNPTTALFGTRRFAPTIPAEPPAWTGSALCAQVDPDLWYPETGSSPADAKHVCAACPVRRECLETAMESEPKGHENRFGVWGGLSPRGRDALAQTGWQAGDPLPPVRGAADWHHVRRPAPEPPPGSSPRARLCRTCNRWLDDLPRHWRTFHGEEAA